MAALTPAKGRAKKEKAIGSGTNKTPSKVTKKCSPKKSSKATEAEFFGALADDDELLKPEEEEGMVYGNAGDEKNGHFDDGDVFYSVKDEDEYA